MRLSPIASLKLLVIAAVLFAVFAVIPRDLAAQRRDFMTEAEIELVRDSQDIDARIDVLTKMIDRRFSALGVAAGGWKQAGKDSEKWGESPKGTRLELLLDIKKLLQKAIDDVDDVAVHNENALTQNKKEGLLFPKAVRNLGAAAARYQNPLRSELDRTKDDKERGVILDALDFCAQIIEAVGKLPPETKKS